MINSINFIDGLDGLSTGVSLIAAVTLGIISITAAPIEPTVALLCAVLAGSLAGFLPWNFHPARIFIGTSGVIAVGYALAVLSILGTAKVAVALLVLGVPIIDTFWIIIRRLRQRQLALRARPRPSPPPAARPRADPSRRGAPHLRHVRRAGLASIVLSSTGAGPLYAFLGVVLGGGLRAVPADPRVRSDALDAASYPDERWPSRRTAHARRRAPGHPPRHGDTARRASRDGRGPRPDERRIGADILRAP